MSTHATSTLWRFLVPVALLIVSSTALLAAYETALQIQEVENDARQQARSLAQLLTATEAVVDGQVRSAMRLLRKRSFDIGHPAIRGSITVAGQSLPNLTLGDQPQTMNHALVDGLSADFGGTATLFVKSGEEFVRVATNVMRDDGRRATLTRLDPKGKAIDALLAGQPFYGVVDILGTPYFTGYEPMFDRNGVLIGAWYVGYPLELRPLHDMVEKIRFLDSGFAAVVDSAGHAHFHSAHVDQARVAQLLRARPADWSFIVEHLPHWNVQVVMAYPTGEARTMGFQRALTLTMFGVLLAMLLLLLLLNQMKKLVYKPLGGDPALAYDLVQRIAAGDLREDDTQAEQGTLIAYILAMRRNLRQMLETLHQNADRLSLSSSVFEHANDGIFITDAAARIVETNPAFTTITHYRREDATGKTPRELLAPLDDPGLFDKIWEQLERNGAWRGETWLSGKDGATFAAWFDVFAVRDPHDLVTHYVGVFSDITHAKEQQQKLERMAYHDPLTQLPNRTLLADRLQQALARAQRSGETIALCYFDMDGFKPINYTLGHEAGDRLLMELAQRVRSCLRADDTVARLGGDEFALLLCNLQGQ
ncbi:MAG: Cache 3/Cache 2 fusion domain-containing protein, partial [Methylophilaceae bacterium]|nr:Cache 3/Cache 2 fusion domain-containing protein [Methylophilaceae bacterium]